MFKLIANRLLRQFQKHNLQGANMLFMNFGQWAAYASRANGKALTPVEAAVQRCRKVAEGVKKIAKHCPPDLPYLGAWYVDTHVPLIRHAAKNGHCSMYEVYKLNLAPEMQGAFPIAVGPPFKPMDALTDALKMAWFSDGGAAKTTLLSKLLQKGTRPPVSIRYIGPQCLRALDESEAGRTAMTAIIVAGALRAYPHSRVENIKWDVHERAVLYDAASVEGIRAAIQSQTARQLFSAVCEYIVAVTSQHLSLWRAVSCSPGGLAHIRSVQENAAFKPRRPRIRGRVQPIMAEEERSKSKAKKTAARTKIPSDITLRCKASTLRQALLATTLQETIQAEPKLSQKEASDMRIFVSRHQAPLMFSRLSQKAAEIQQEAVMRTTGAPELLVTVCKTCTVIHRKIKGAPPPIKKRSGISVCIPVTPLESEDASSTRDLTPFSSSVRHTKGRCAACGTNNSGIMLNAIGLEIRARVRHSDAEALTVMVCGSCGVLASNTVNMLGAPRCRECAEELNICPWPRGVTRMCLCGGQAAVAPAILVKVSTTTRGHTKLLPVCAKHVAIAKHIPPVTAVPAKWLRELFRTRTPRNKAKVGKSRRRLKQYTSARKFLFSSGRQHSHA